MILALDLLLHVACEIKSAEQLEASIQYSRPARVLASVVL